MSVNGGQAGRQEEHQVKLLDKLTVHHNAEPRTIELYQGDLTQLGPEHVVDILVVSARPGNYRPVKGTLIHSLSKVGVSMSELSRDKAIDLSDSFAWWLSQSLADQGLGFNRILCFEPASLGRPGEVIGDIFQSFVAFTGSEPDLMSMAMPLVATGIQAEPIVDVLEPLIEAAVNWLELGLPVRTLKIVEINAMKAAEMKGAFGVLKKRYDRGPIVARRSYRHDLFISYSHQNSNEALYLVAELQRLRPELRIFLDKKDLNAGAAWQQELYEALDDCHKVVALYSPGYIESRVCKEEYNIALFRHRDNEEGTLIPLYLYSTKLPSYMKLVQFIDCREGHRGRMSSACEEILASLEA